MPVLFYLRIAMKKRNPYCSNSTGGSAPSIEETILFCVLPLKVRKMDMSLNNIRRIHPLHNTYLATAATIFTLAVIFASTIIISPVSASTTGNSTTTTTTSVGGEQDAISSTTTTNDSKDRK